MTKQSDFDKFRVKLIPWVSKYKVECEHIRAADRKRNDLVTYGTHKEFTKLAKKIYKYFNK